MTVIGVIVGLLAGFWGGVLVERSRWVIDSVGDFPDGPHLPHPPMRRLGTPRLHDEDTLCPGRWRVLWCRLTSRHGGYVGQDRLGTYWQCVNCTKRVY